MTIYISKNNQQLGPFEELKVLEMLRRGELSRDDLAIRHGENEWQKLGVFFPNVGNAVPERPIVPSPAATPVEASTGRSSRAAMDAWVRQNLATPIKVPTQWAQYAAIIVLVIMFGVPAAAAFVIQAYWATTGSRYYSDGAFAGGLIVMLLMVGVCYLFLRSEKKTVKFFDSSGVTLKNGRLFRWDEFIGVNYQYIAAYKWRPSVCIARLEFNDGMAVIGSGAFKEARKIIALIESLPGEHTGKMADSRRK